MTTEAESIATLARKSAAPATIKTEDGREFLIFAEGATVREISDEHSLQVTAPRSRFRSFPAYLPVASLDKAFVRGPVDVRHARIVRSRLARDASDHIDVCAVWGDRHRMGPEERVAGGAA